MEGINVIVDYLGRTNLFNFIIFLSVFILIYKYANLGEKLEAAKNGIIQHIEESKTKKADSEIHLKETEEILAHVGEEVEGIIKKSEENAKLVGEKILADAKKSIENIKDNTGKAIENKSALLKNDIIRRASIASVDVAKARIINELNNNPELHQRFIDESIGAINMQG